MSSNQENAKPVIVTTSWDDGDQLDLKLAEVLRATGVGATFYIPIQHYRSQVLSRAEMRSLVDKGFEIGAHSVSHKLLRGLSERELSAEITPCKPILEDIVGDEVRMFCYPRGRYDANTVRAVKKAGYSGARTVRMLFTGTDFDPFQIPTTVQSFPHSPSTYFRNAAKECKFESLRACLSHRSGLRNWIELGKRLFDSVLERGGVWHMYGHSWEIEEYGLWNDLGELLEYVSRRPGVRYVPNRDLVACARSQA
jgi:peptidoglycan-N-acetylglucosamine deacetylase